MKRCLCGMVCLLLCLFLAGCGGQSEVIQGELVVCLEEADYDRYSVWLQRFLQENPDVSLKFIKIPSTYSAKTGAEKPNGDEKRAAFLTQLRVQIMAGEGPDVYLLSAANGVESVLFDALYKNMEAGVFAALERRMQASDTAQPAHFIPAVLQAGQQDGAQYLLPLSYSVYGVLTTQEFLQEIAFDPAQATDTASFFRQGDGHWGVLPATDAAYWDAPLPDLSAVNPAAPLQKPYGIPTLQAVQTVRPSPLTEPQRRAVEEDQFALFHASLPMEQQYLHVSRRSYPMDIACEWSRSGTETPRFLPLPNGAGTVTGFLDDFAAIGQNSKNKATAFALLELLCSEDGQLGRTDNTGRSILQSTANGALPARCGLTSAYLQSYVAQTAARTGAVLPPAQTQQDFSALETKLGCVLLQDSPDFRIQRTEAFAAYLEGEVSYEDMARKLRDTWAISAAE